MENKRYTPEEVLNLQSQAYQKGCNEGYELCKKQHPGIGWVKCSDRLPGYKKRVKWRDGNDHSYATDGEISLFEMDKPNLEGWEWLDESGAAAAGREDWINVDERPLIKRDGEWWELTEDGEKEFIAAVPYHDAATADPKKERWWIRHCFIDGEGFLYVKRDNEMDEDVAGWNVSDITHWKPLPEPPKFKQQKEK